MVDVYRSPAPGAPVQRAILGLVLFGAGEYEQLFALPTPAPYQGMRQTWGRPLPESMPLALAVLANAVGEECTADDSWPSTTAWRLHEAFAEAVIRTLDPAAPLALD